MVTLLRYSSSEGFTYPDGVIVVPDAEDYTTLCIQMKDKEHEVYKHEVELFTGKEYSYEAYKAGEYDDLDIEEMLPEFILSELGYEFHVSEGFIVHYMSDNSFTAVNSLSM